MRHYLILFIFFCSFAFAQQVNLQSARILFYQAMNDKKIMDRAEKSFLELMKLNPHLEGKCRVYLGTLTAVKAKYAFWPMTKLSYVNEAFTMMDKGLTLSPDDAESQFIYGMTCMNLPSFFDRHDDAKPAFIKTSRLLVNQTGSFDRELLKNMTDFLVENKYLAPDEKLKIMSKKDG